MEGDLRFKTGVGQELQKTVRKVLAYVVTVIILLPAQSLAGIIMDQDPLWQGQSLYSAYLQLTENRIYPPENEYMINGKWHKITNAKMGFSFYTNGVVGWLYGKHPFSKGIVYFIENRTLKYVGRVESGKFVDSAHKYKNLIGTPPPPDTVHPENFTKVEFKPQPIINPNDTTKKSPVFAAIPKKEQSIFDFFMTVVFFLLIVFVVLIAVAVAVAVVLRGKSKSAALPVALAAKKNASPCTRNSVHISPTPPYACSVDIPQQQDAIFTCKFSPKKFFSGREYHFYNLLREIFNDNRFAIFSKVKLLDIIETDSYAPYDIRKRQNMRIKELHIDFVLFDLHKKEVALLIELDDSSHNSPVVQERDNKKEESIMKSGLKFLRVPAGWFVREKIEAQIREII